MHYGVTSTNLNGTSPIVLGLDDVTSTNRQFSIVLEGLEAETTYYYQIEARNSIGSIFSSVADFITPPMGMYSVVFLFPYIILSITVISVHCILHYYSL